MIPNFYYDPELVEDIAANFDLREQNKDALTALVERLAGDYDPESPLVLDIATGAGKTYLMAAFIEYLRRLGHANVLIVTPGLVVQHKTLGNFTAGHPKYIAGAGLPARVITPENYITQLQETLHDQDLGGETRSDVYVFNIQQLIAPSSLEGSTTEGKEAARRGIRKYNEFVGVLYDDLAAMDNLVVIADEHHLYGPSAKAFNAAIKDLHPAATIGLTATADARDDVIYRYPLHQAISDKHIKSPVIAYRKGGYGELGEHQQLRDAVSLLHGKEKAYTAYLEANPAASKVRPLLFVVCSDIDHASHVTDKLRSAEFFGSQTAVLQVDSDHMTSDTEHLLETLDRPDTPVRAVVSVNKLKEGWDVKNIAVMVTLRAMDSDILTQQTMGRGLRLPFGTWVDDPAINELDIVAHESFRKLLESENVLRSFGLVDAIPDGNDPGEVVSPHDRGKPKVRTDSGAASPTTGETDPPLPNPLPGDTGEPTEVVLGGQGGVKARQIGGDEPGDITPPPPPAKRVKVSVQPQFAGQTFIFPRTTMERDERPFELIDITDAEIEAVAQTITTQGDLMERVALTADLVRKRLRTQTRLQAEVDSMLTDVESVKSTLFTQLFALRSITQSKANIADAKGRIIPLLVASAQITEWTDNAKSSAVAVLSDLVSQKTKAYVAKLNVQVVFDPVELPITDAYYLAPGQAVHDQNQVQSRAQFTPRQHYGPWLASMFTSEAFDSYSGEFKLAELLDKSTKIVWWKRLYRRDGASIAYTINNDYYADFAARDTEGRLWIIEGKSELGKSDEVVQRKKDVAEETIRRMHSHPEFAGKLYGYLIGYESTIAESNSWSELVDKSKPAITRVYD